MEELQNTKQRGGLQGIVVTIMVIKNAGHGPSFKGGLNVSEVEGKRIQWFKKHLLDQ